MAGLVSSLRGVTEQNNIYSPRVFRPTLKPHRRYRARYKLFSLSLRCCCFLRGVRKI